MAGLALKGRVLIRKNPHLEGVLVEAANIAALVSLCAWVWHLFPNLADLVAD
jgi:hypothetical protein